MVTDSGRFRYSSTNARTFELAAYLMSQPIDTSAIYSELYTDDWRMIRARLVRHEGPLYRARRGLYLHDA